MFKQLLWSLATDIVIIIIISIIMVCYHFCEECLQLYTRTMFLGYITLQLLRSDNVCYMECFSHVKPFVLTKICAKCPVCFL